jgi:hypothetical protein
MPTRILGQTPTGPGSTGSKLAWIAGNVLMGGGAALANGAAGYMKALRALDEAYKPPTWVKPFLNGAGNAPYLGVTAAQLLNYPWKLC